MGADFAALYLAIALEDYAAKHAGVIADIHNVGFQNSLPRFLPTLPNMLLDRI